jgi:hypothetical protein
MRQPFRPCYTPADVLALTFNKIWNYTNILCFQSDFVFNGGNKFPCPSLCDFIVKHHIVHVLATLQPMNELFTAYIFPLLHQHFDPCIEIKTLLRKWKLHTVTQTRQMAISDYWTSMVSFTILSMKEICVYLVVFIIRKRDTRGKGIVRDGQTDGEGYHRI